MRKIHKCPECDGKGELVHYTFNMHEGTFSYLTEKCGLCKGKKKLAYMYKMRHQLCRKCDGKGAILCKYVPGDCQQCSRYIEYIIEYQVELKKVSRSSRYRDSSKYNHYTNTSYRYNSIMSSINYWKSRKHYIKCDNCHNGGLTGWSRLDHKHRRGGQKKKGFGRKTLRSCS